MQTLQWKSTVFTILGAIITYTLSKGYIDGDMAQLLSAILIAVGGGVNIHQNILLPKRKE